MKYGKQVARFRTFPRFPFLMSRVTGRSERYRNHLAGIRLEVRGITVTKQPEGHLCLSVLSITFMIFEHCMLNYAEKDKMIMLFLSVIGKHIAL